MKKRRPKQPLTVSGNLIPDLVPDPTAPGRQRSVLRSTRDDPLAALWARDQIDGEQYDAGRRWQATWSIAYGRSMRSLDLTKDFFDAGVRSVDIPARQLDAIAMLEAIAVCLGEYGDALVRSILGEGMSYGDVCRLTGEDTEARRKYVGVRFRECLTTIARFKPKKLSDRRQ